MRLNVMLAAAAAMLVGTASAATVYPGGSTGVLSPFPAQFGDLFGTGKPLATFSDDFAFDLSAKSTATGSLSVFFGSVSFSSVLIDGNSLALSATPSGYGFSLANLGVGTHTLTVAGSYPTGANAYSGSLYATDPVPEPESFVMALMGLGVMGLGAARRRLLRQG